MKQSGYRVAMLGVEDLPPPSLIKLKIARLVSVLYSSVVPGTPGISVWQHGGSTGCV